MSMRFLFDASHKKVDRSFLFLFLESDVLARVTSRDVNARRSIARRRIDRRVTLTSASRIDEL